MDRRTHLSVFNHFVTSLSAFKLSRRLLFIACLGLAVASCGGGGGGGSSSDDNTGNVEPATTTLFLGAPAPNPVVVPLSTEAREVTFISVVSGTAYPEVLQLDEVDRNGNVLAARVGQLRDDGEGADAHRGDRVYTGTLLTASPNAAEKLYQVYTDGRAERSSSSALWISGCPAQARPSDPKQAVADTLTDARIFANEVIMTVAPTLAPDLQTLNDIAAQVDGRVVGCIPSLRQYLLEIDGDGSADGVYGAINTLLEQPDQVVERASPNVQALDLPLVDNYECDGQQCQWYLDRIRAPEAWAISGGGDEQLGVAVIDFGVNCAHPELDCDASRFNEDVLDHGTGVASLIGADNADDTNVSGVAWNTALYPYSFLGRSGSQYKMSELITRSLSEDNIRVINVSAVTPVDNDQQILNAVCSAIASGRLVVAGAGNASNNNCEIETVYPARYNQAGLQCPNHPNVDLASGLLVVGASDINNALAEWGESERRCSNQRYVDVFAPGKNIYTASNLNEYAAKSGTSYATPLVSGSAALVWSAEPNLSPAQLHQQLVGSASRFSQQNTNPRLNTSDSRLDGQPLLDVYAALGGSDEAREADIVPNDFSFDARTEVALNTPITSNAVVIDLIDSRAPIDIRGGYYAINGGPFTNASGSVALGDTLRLQTTSGPLGGSTTQVSVTVGGYTTAFDVSTRADDTRPDNFNFVDQEGAPLSTQVSSNALEIPGINTDTPITIEGGTYSLNGGNFVRTPGVVNESDSIRLQALSAATPETSTTITVTIGGVADTFTVTTEAADTLPTPFSFSVIEQAELNTPFDLELAAIEGLNTLALVSISNGEYAIDGGPFTNEVGLIGNGQRLSVRHTSAEREDSTEYTAISVGDFSTVVQSTTRRLPPMLVDMPLLRLVQNTPLSPQSFSNTGGQRISDCSADTALPAGINLGISADGNSCTLSGTPSETLPETTYTVTATNESGSNSASLSLAVSEALLPPVLTAPEPQVYDSNQPIRLAIANTGGGDISDCTVSPALPTGLSLAISADQQACEISGTPTAVQEAATYTVTAINASGSAETSVSLAVLSLPAFATVPPLSVIANSPIVPLTLSSTNGVGIIDCEAEPALPPGLSLNATSDGSGCQLSGVPTIAQSQTVYTLTATNGDGQGSTSLSISVQEALPALMDEAFTATTATPVDWTLSNNGGGAITSCSATNPSLPSGLSLSPTTDNRSCVISGTPASAQAATVYTVSATNNTGASNARITITVNEQAPALGDLTNLDNVVVGESVNWVFPNNGGGNITACTSTALPDGLSTSPTADRSSCQLTGSPLESAANNTGSYTVTASNSAGSDSAIITITVQLANTPPVATNVTISDENGGELIVGDTLSGAYTYTDADQNPEGTSTYRWLRGNTPIANATALRYTTVAADANQAITFEVTPVAQAGVSTGIAVASSAVNPIPVDTTPDAFSFNAQTDVDINTLVVSNAITVAGINAPAGISITGGEYAIDGGAFTSAAGTLNNGQTVTVRLSSSNNYGESSSATLNIGSVEASFNVATLLVDSPQVEIIFPPAIGFTDQSSITVRGRAYDPQGDAINYVRVNGEDAASSDGFANWQIENYTLQPSENLLETETQDSNLDGEIGGDEALLRHSVGPLFAGPRDINFDLNTNQLYVLDSRYDRLIQVDTVTGERAVVSSTSSPGTDIGNPERLAIGDGVAYVFDDDSDDHRIFAVDLNTGSKTIISSDSVGAGPVLGEETNSDFIGSMAWDSTNNRILLSVELLSGERQLWSVNPVSGDRSVIRDGVDRYYAMAVDAENNRLLTSSSSGLGVSNLGTGEIVNTYGLTNRGIDNVGVSDVAYYEDIVYLADRFSRRLLSFNLNTQQLNIISGEGVGNGPLPSRVDNLSLDGQNGHAYLLDRIGDTVFKVNLANGDREVQSGHGLLSERGPSVPGFSNRRGMAFDTQNNRIFVNVNDSLMVLDLVSGGKSLVLDSEGNTVPSSIDIDYSGNKLFTIDYTGIYVFDLATGNPTLLSSSLTGVGEGRDLADAKSLVVDEVNNRAFVTSFTYSAGGGSVIQVNLATGDRQTLISSSQFEWPYNAALDRLNNRLIIFDGQYYERDSNLFALDLVDNTLTGLAPRFLPTLEGTEEMALNVKNNRVLMTAQGEVVAFDLETATTEVIMSSSEGSGPYQDSCGNIEIDEERDLIYVNCSGILFAVDGLTKQRVMLAD